MTNRAVGYIRVSSTSQASPEKTSLERQAEKIKLQARLKEFELVKIYDEAGVSGATMDRPALQELMADAEAHKFEAVIVWDISRFGRNLLHLKQNTERLKELGIAFLAIDNGIDTSNRDKTGELLLNILASIYEFELETIKTRVLGGRLLKWQRGEIPMGEIPYGYRWSHEKKQYEHCPEEAPVYKRLVDDILRTRDASITQLARQYQKEGLPTRNRKNIWTSAQLSQILRHENPHVTGKYVTKEFIYTVEPFILPSRWKEVQEKLNSNKIRSGRPALAKDSFLLHKLISCPICGNRTLQGVYIAARRAKGGSPRRYVCYRHTATLAKLNGIPRCSMPPLPADALEANVLQSFRRLLLTYENNSDQFETQEQELQLEIAELEREKQGWEVTLANLDQLRRMPDFDPKAWFKMFQDDTVASQRVIATIAEKKVELDELRQKKAEQEFLIQYRAEAMENLQRFADDILEAPFKIKQRLIAGSVAGSIVVTPLPDGQFEISIPWKLNLLLLRETLAVLYPAGADANNVNHKNGSIRGGKGLPGGRNLQPGGIHHGSKTQAFDTRGPLVSQTEGATKLPRSLRRCRDQMERRNA